MRRRVPKPVIAVLVAMSVAAAVAGCGGDDEPAAQGQATTATAPAPATTPESVTRTTTAPDRSGDRAKKGTAGKGKGDSEAKGKGKPAAKDKPGPALENPRAKILESARKRRRRDVAAGARSCPDAKTITNLAVTKVSCDEARRIITSTTVPGKHGFDCEIKSESFATDVPVIAYKCEREGADAKFDYTAVG